MVPSQPSLLIIADLFFATRLREMATQLGYIPHVGRNFQEAIGICREHPLSHVVLDLNVMGFDWESLVQALHADTATQAIPILAFTNHANKEQIARARELGCDRVVTKGQITQRFAEFLGAEV